jgi:hypothetical protein
MSAYAGLFLVILILFLIHSRLSRHPMDPVALFTYFVGFFYVARELIITFHWDTPYPDFLFVPGQTQHLLVKAAVGLSAFLIAFAVAYVIAQPHAGSFARFTPAVWTVPSVHRHIRLVVFLTVAATIVSVLLVARYHGVGGMIRAGKKTGSLAGSYELRIFPAMGTIMAAALMLTLWHRRAITGRRAPAYFAGMAALLNAAYVFLWGSRQAAAGVMVVLMAGQWLLSRDETGAGRATAVARRKRPRPLMVLALAAMLVAAVVGLRLFRDTVVAGHVTASIQGQSRIRQLSVSTNSTSFDAMLLALRDWPSVHQYHGGQDFFVGAEGVVPRILWPGKPQDVRPGAQFRQVYEPDVQNGWPLGAAGDWYLNFGFIGIIVGGALSGVLFSVLSEAWWRAAWTPVTLASLTCVVLFVVPTGIDALALLHAFQWALPLWLCARYLDAGARAWEPATVSGSGMVQATRAQ